MTSPKVSYILNPSQITLVDLATGDTHTLDVEHPNFDLVRTAIKEKRFEDAFKLLDLRNAVVKYGNGRVEVKNDNVYIDGVLLNDGLSRHIIEMMKGGFDVEPLILFTEKLQQNPSFRSREQLFGFINANKITIDPEGDLILYKRVRDDYYDIHTGRTFRNKPGDYVAMPRAKVDDDPTRTCSTGLHVCSLAYLQSFGGARLVLCKVNPTHVVSIPTDYNNSKMRVSEYYVVGEVKEDKKEFTNKPVYDYRDEDETYAENYNDYEEDYYYDSREPF